jgi:hypothetical protein
MRFGVFGAIAAIFFTATAAGQDSKNVGLRSQFEKAGANRAELESALNRAPAVEREGMEFLIENMPERDLQSLKADFLLENNRLAYRAWQEATWKEKIPK